MSFTPTSVVEVIREVADGIVGKIDELFTLLKAIELNTRGKK